MFTVLVCIFVMLAAFKVKWNKASVCLSHCSVY